ncbi:hypothetical protein G4B88_029454 [Cannabis sativa]|uniref:NADH-ubiquinone oxidoreductase chain 4L n=1 Tax=Cannabis sativa TaxID=3483 RepID=A0A7J6HC95_CANSA|nr:hypothetical protein G4B88_029454 [Cannabis sativa]
MEKEPLSVGGGRSDAGPSTFRPTEKLEIPPSQIDEDLFWQEVMNSAEEKREAAPTPARITGGATAHRSPLARVSRHVQGAREAHRADPPSSENGWNAYPGRKAHGALGIWGILLNRRNILIMLMSIELMLLAVNFNFLVFSVSLDDMMGQLFALLVLTVAAAKSAIGLAIFVITFRVRGTIAVEFINSIQGSGPFSLGERIRF